MRASYKKIPPLLRNEQNELQLESGSKKLASQQTAAFQTHLRELFKRVFLVMLLTIPFFSLLEIKRDSRVLAQTRVSCPDGSAPGILDWDNTVYPLGSFNQTFDLNGVQANFQFTENPPGFIRDASPPRPLGPVPLGTDTGPYGGINQRFLRWGIDAMEAPLGFSTLTITFSSPVVLPSPLLFFDVDKDRPDEVPFQDQITVTAFNATAPVDVTLNAVNPSFVGVFGNVARGIQSNAPPSSSDANVQVRFAGPVTRIVVVYNSGLGAIAPGQDETIGLGDIAVCRTPVSNVADPQVRLVKRITNVFRNNQPLTDFNFNSFVDDPSDTNDNALTRSPIQPIGLPRIETPLQSGDEVEYTVYFVNDGAGPARNIRFCDLVPSGTTYNPEAFGTNRGIAVNLNGQVNSLSNTGNDQGFYRPLQPLPNGNSCSNQNNPNGAVIVNLGDINNTPGSNFGFVRFRATID